MSEPVRTNRFEKNRKAIFAVFYSFIGLVLLVGALFAVKAVRDESLRGFQRSIVLREPRVASDISKAPPASLIAVADGLENKRYRMRVDENGFIIPSAVHKKPDASVVFLGGSTTECHYMGEEERFPFLVGRELEASLGGKINTYNGGNAGNNTLHCILLLQGKVLPMRPRAVVLMEAINDLSFLMILGDYWAPHATRGIVQDKEYNFVKTWILRNTGAYVQAKADAADEFAEERSRGAQLDPVRMSKSYRKNLELFVFLCRQHGITPVLMTQFNRLAESLPENLARQMKPVQDQWRISYDKYRESYQALNQTVRDVAREQKVALVDLDREVPKTPEYMYDIVHLNANGARLVSGIVAKALAPLLR